MHHKQTDTKHQHAGNKEAWYVALRFRSMETVRRMPVAMYVFH